MKTTIKLLFVLLITLTTSCQSDDDGGGDPISQLPEATQTGEQTIGCLVNGEALLPNADGDMQCFYQFIDGEYFLGVSFSKRNSPASKNIRLSIKRVELIENQTYLLDNDNSISEPFTGGSGTFTQTENFIEGGEQYETNENASGTLTITKLSDGIISGTFEFTAQEITTGALIEITEGRFDLLCTN